MMNLHRRFDTALRDTVKEWKKRDEVKGIFTFGAIVKGTLTANADLDVGVIWDGAEAPVKLLSKHKEVLIDLIFLTPKEIENVFEGNVVDAFRIGEIIGRLRGAKVVHDKGGMLKAWLDRAAKYKWSEKVIAQLKSRVFEALDNAETCVEEEDYVSAVHELRTSLFNIGRVVLMRNNLFCITRPSEILTEIRMLDPLTYQLFLRTFKLKGLKEDKLLEILDSIKEWLSTAEVRFEQTSVDELSAELLTQAQREYHGALNLTINGDYELAVLEVRGCIYMLGRVLLALGDVPSTARGKALIRELSINESIFYEQVLVEYGAFEFQPKAIRRSISEAKFIIQRL